MSTSDYPLMDHAAGSLHAASGRSVDEITLDEARAGALHNEDLQIEASTLREQARIAAEAGYPQLAANLSRAAELTAVPNDELLQIYEMLRPGRASFEVLNALADRFETVYDAPFNAAFVREAAAAYQSRGLLRREA
jgi:propanediol dehydratase small subunit